MFLRRDVLVWLRTRLWGRKGMGFAKVCAAWSKPSAVTQVCSLCLILKMSQKKEKCTAIRSRDVPFVTLLLISLIHCRLLCCSWWLCHYPEVSAIPWSRFWLCILPFFCLLLMWETSGRSLAGFAGGLLGRLERCIVKVLHPHLKIALACWKRGFLTSICQATSLSKC